MSDIKPLILGGLLIALLLAIFTANRTNDAEEKKRQASRVETAKSAPAGPVERPTGNVPVGQDGFIYSGTKVVVVARTKEALDQVIKSKVAKDPEGLMELAVARDVFFVDANTRARVIDSTFLTRRVRILEGKSQGQSGWIPKEYIRP